MDQLVSAVVYSQAFVSDVLQMEVQCQFQVKEMLEEFGCGLLNPSPM
jgi:hypothetical protein